LLVKEEGWDVIPSVTEGEGKRERRGAGLAAVPATRDRTDRHVRACRL